MIRPLKDMLMEWIRPNREAFLKVDLGVEYVELCVVSCDCGLYC